MGEVGRKTAAAWLTTRPIAHRGLHDIKAGILENTRSAFEQACKKNYPIECDVQLSADGEAMVFHDDTLDRLTGRTGDVGAFSAEELAQIPLHNSTDHIETLGALLAQVQSRVPLLIEIKTRWNDDDRLVRRVMTLLADYAGPCAVMSFDPHIVEAVRQHSPDLARGMVADRGHDPEYNALPWPRQHELRTHGWMAATEPDFVSFHFSELPVPAISSFRESGHPVISWTIRSPEQAAEARRFSDQITFEGFLP